MGWPIVIRLTAILHSGILLFAPVLAAAVLVFTLAGPRLFGVEADAMWGGSMAPAIRRGSLMLVREVAPTGIAPGDVIAYSSSVAPGTVVTHRVVDVVRRHGQLAFLTKGDANESPDPQPVPATQVRGKVVAHVPWVGYLTLFVRTPLGFVLLLLVPSLFIAWGEVRNIASALREGRRQIGHTSQGLPRHEGKQEDAR